LIFSERALIMEFNEKLQELRKQKGLTQEELAESLYVSRTAISKWESGRGYPSIDSLKAIAKYFGVTIDQLLSGEELLTIAEEDSKQKQTRIRTLVFALLDCSSVLFFFLPFFRQTANSGIQEVSLLALTQISPWLKTSYFVIVFLMIGAGIWALAMQKAAYASGTHRFSLFCNMAVVFLFIISPQPYAAAFGFVLLIIKVFMLKNKP